MSPDSDEDAASWSVVDAATHGSSTHVGSSQRALWPLDPLLPTSSVHPASIPTDDEAPLPPRPGLRS